MVCDIETGVCGEVEGEQIETVELNNFPKKATVYYVTDPICSHCWALEPVLRKFQMQYGHYFTIQTIMGGLLEKWDGFQDKGNGINGPQDVAMHWREVGENSRMPIDGTLWYDNPVHSSFVPSRVFKVIQQIGKQQALIFLRRAREAVFVFNQNIADNQVLINIVNKLGLDGKDIVNKASLPQAEQLLLEDFAVARELGVRAFPTVIIVNSDNRGVKIVGARTFDNYANGLQQVFDGKELEPKNPQPLANVLENDELLFSKEIEVLYDVEKTNIPAFIEKELLPEKYEQHHILNEMYVKNR